MIFTLSELRELEKWYLFDPSKTMEPRRYSDKLRKKRVTKVTPNAKGFYVRPKNHARQYR